MNLVNLLCEAIYIALALFVVYMALKFWRFKVLTAPSIIQAQFALFLAWCVFLLPPMTYACLLGKACVVFAVIFKFVIDVLLWKRAKRGLKYLCSVWSVMKQDQQGQLVMLTHRVPVVVVKTAPDLCVEAGRLYWCRILRYSLVSGRVEVELLSEYDGNRRESVWVETWSEKLNLA